MKLLGPMRADVQKNVDKAVAFLVAALEWRELMHGRSRKKIEGVVADLRGAWEPWDFDGYRETLRDAQSDDLMPHSVSANIDRARDSLYDASRAWDEVAAEERAQVAAFRAGVFQ